MTGLIRKSWFRVCVVGVVIAALNFFLPSADLASLRDGTSKALQATALIFAVCTALALAILNNYVKGLNESALKRISDIRSIIEKIYDEHKNSDDPDVQEIIHNYLLPLLNFTTHHWLAFDPIKPTLSKIVEPGTRLHAKDNSVIPRYFLRLEDEINQLGILYVRRVVAGLHLKTIQGVFVLVCVGIVTIVAAFTLPSTTWGHMVSVNASLTVIAFSVVELLLLMSYIAQEALEETPEVNGDPDDDET